MPLSTFKVTSLTEGRSPPGKRFVTCWKEIDPFLSVECLTLIGELPLLSHRTGCPGAKITPGQFATTLE